MVPPRMTSLLRTSRVLAPVAFVVGCAPSPGGGATAPEVASATVGATASVPGPPHPAGATSATPREVAGDVTAADDLPASEVKLTRLFEQPVRFLITGEDGRLAVLAIEEGKIVPHRFESGKWSRLELPEAHRAVADDEIGIYFGRDNRPRLMGYRAAAKKMVYLRHRDGKWQEQRSEIGALAAEDAHLFGVLGEADPEVVCRVGTLCLIKSRKGWQEVKPEIPASAVVRAFHGRGYALSEKALMVAGAKGFEQVGPAGPWTTRPTGFWIAPDGGCVVVEPERSLVHELDAGATAWRTERSPIVGPRDVVGPASARTIVGDGGIARGASGKYTRVGDRGLRESRAIQVGDQVVVGGASGVARLF
jgi:hypothetical protein